MRTITITLSPEGEPMPVMNVEPEFAPVPEWEGRPMTGVGIHQIDTRGEIELQLVRIAAGGNFVMHASPKLAFCHVVRGAGTMGLPGGAVAYRGPETFVFHPGTLHDWHDVTEDTLLAVAIVADQS